MADIEQARPQTADEKDVRLEEKATDVSKKSQIREDKDERDEAFLVTFGPDNPDNPLNWSKKIKWSVTGALSATGFNRIMVSTVGLTF